MVSKKEKKTGSSFMPNVRKIYVKEVENKWGIFSVKWWFSSEWDAAIIADYSCYRHPTPCTSQGSAWNDYDACQDQETSKVDIGEIFYKQKRQRNFLTQGRLWPCLKSITSWQFLRSNLNRRHSPLSTLLVAIVVFVYSGCHSTPGWCRVNVLMEFSVQLVLFSVPVH